MKPAWNPEPHRSDLDAMTGWLLLEFGANWCGFCQAIQPMLGKALAQFPGLRHERIEDGRGKRLGRSFKVKLWPTLVLLHNGVEVGRVVRPQRPEEISQLLTQATESCASTKR
ncbi:MULTISPECIES: thioredoxin family protein [Methylobacillus]|uniref:Thioredoxin-related protein n=1 Tax=Methylobacillus flagellatus (strain ATCC 51484 / DSM 6875 / VKM B-1610 / KT) TaxID=265072 RepID=Q1H1Z7_METFK|nr:MULTISPECIES: thioredoxin family protein [Methylobacillus]ABE49490.1 thioredoxin-related protein [Methylobacillus flagellatus KT]MPS47971.1 thioredoxin [Methylobacillus sp.]